VNFGSTSGNVAVTANNSCGSSSAQTAAVTVTTAPNTPGVITGNTSVCTSTTGVAYSIASVAGATSYTWTVPTGATVASGQGTDAITVNFGATSGNVSVTASNSCGTSSARSASVTLTSAPATPGTVTGDASVCANATGVSYGVAAVSGATTYTWTVPSGATIVSGQGTTSISVNFGTTSGNVTVTAGNTCGTSSAQTSAVTVTSIPATPGAITGNTGVCAGDTGVAFSIAAVSGATSYTWTVPSGATVASGQGTTSVTVDFGSTSGSVSVTADNACGSSTAQSSAVTVTAIPVTPGAITGNTSLCASDTGVAYSITAVSGATGYTWTVPAGASIISGQGTTAISVDFGATSGDVSVTADNGCGSSSTQTATVTVTSIPATPTSITGNASVCANDTGVAYSIAAVSGATSYTWTVPAGATIASGQGTETIAVNFGDTAGDVGVTATNSCGTSSAQTIAVAVSAIPSVPGAITGTASVCANASSVSFGINAVAGATSYTWTVPSGASVTAGQGTTDVTIDFGTASGDVAVVAENSCSTSSAQSLAVQVTSAPALPGTISGSVSLCANDGAEPYSIAPVSGATEYTWTVPTGANIVSGQGTTSITVDFGTVAGLVSVTAGNSCGASLAQTLSVALDAAPAVPGAIVGVSTVCLNETAVAFSVAPVSGSTGYTWTIPSGATLVSGQGASGIVVDMGAASGDVTVTADNDCGSSAAQVLAVVAVDCSGQVLAQVASELLLNFATADLNVDGLLSFDEARGVASDLTSTHFETLDSDDDGFLSRSELGAGDDLFGSARTLAEGFEEGDANDDNVLDFDEALALDPSYTALRFSRLDRNGDGVLDISELSADAGLAGLAEILLAAFAEADTDESGGLVLAEVHTVDATVVDLEFTALDADGDGALTRNELGEMAPLFDFSLTLLAGFALGDADGNGGLTYFEALSIDSSITPLDFIRLDSNGDGLLDESELNARVLLDELADVLLADFAALDTDSSGGITLAELRAENDDASELAFVALDSDGSGAIEVEELGGSDGLEGVADLLSAGFATGDTNSDGFLSYPEARIVLDTLTPLDVARLDLNEDGQLSLSELNTGLGLADVAAALLEDFEGGDSDDSQSLSLSEAVTLSDALNGFLFDLLDTDGDGVLVTAELGARDDLFALGLALRLNLSEGDMNDDMRLTLEEALTVDAAVTPLRFDRLDVGGDGELDEADMGAELNLVLLAVTLLLGFEEGDVDDSAGLTRAEAITIAAVVTPLEFNALDVDLSGALSRVELGEQDPLFAIAKTLLTDFGLGDSDGNELLDYFEALVTEGEITPLRFARLDVNSDEGLAIGELGTGENLAVIAATLLSGFVAGDLDESGELSLDEAFAINGEVTAILFDSFDTNGSGGLSRFELGENDPLFAVLLDLLRVFDVADTDDSDALEFAEARAQVPSLTPLRFARIDLDNDGGLSRVELGGEEDLLDTATILLPGFEGSDEDGDEMLSLEEALGSGTMLTTQLFNALDGNGDGFLSRVELGEDDDLFGSAMTLLEMFATGDTDGDMQLSYLEAARANASMTPLRFSRLDTNNDGFLQAEELGADEDLVAIATTLLDSFNAADINEDEGLSVAEARVFVETLTAAQFDGFDLDNDNLLTREELGEGDEVYVLSVSVLADFAAGDTNDDSFLSMTEALGFNAELTPLRFARLDTNLDGRLDASELSSERSLSLVAELLLEGFDDGDGDTSGDLTLAEAEGVDTQLTYREFDGLDNDHNRVLTRLELGEGDEVYGLVLELASGFEEADLDENMMMSLPEASVFNEGASPLRFDWIDGDNDGQLVLTELGEGRSLPDVADTLLMNFDDADEDSNDALSLVEVRTVDSETSELEFDALDADDTGQLSRIELGEGLEVATTAGILLGSFDMGDLNDDMRMNMDEARGVDPTLTPLPFGRMDTSSNGTLERDELGDGDDLAGSAQLMLDAFAEVDGDESGGLTLEEALMADATVSTLRFERLDTDGDGELSRSELAEGDDLATIARDLFAGFDTGDGDNDEMLSFEEAQAIYMPLTPLNFDRLDTSRDGLLSTSELGDGDNLALVAALLLNGFSNGDQNLDGVLSTSEATSVLDTLTPLNYDRLDVDLSGGLDRAELAEGDDLAVIAAELLAGFETGDGNSDTFLTFEEAVTVRATLTPLNFDRLDVNLDNLLDRSELGEGGNLDDIAAELLAGFSDGDGDTSGGLSYEEAVSIRATLTALEFDRLDADKSQALSRVELGEEEDDGGDTSADIIRALRNGFDGGDNNNDDFLSFNEAAAIYSGLTMTQFNEIDTDNDGMLSRAEVGSSVPNTPAGCCNNKKMEPFDLKNILGDVFLLGLSMLALLGCSVYSRKT